MDSKETGSNSYPESDSLLNQMEAKTPRCKDDVEITYGKSFRENSIRRCSRQISSETWFLILTILGVAFGVLIGATVRMTDPSETVVTLVAFPGELFMRMLKMLIIPILFTSVVVGLASIDYKKSGKMWIHCFVYYIATTVLATILGITLVIFIHPGNPALRKVNFAQQEQQVTSTFDSFLDLFRNLIPDNIIAACFQVTQTKLTKVMPNQTTASKMDSNVTENSTSLKYSKSIVKTQSTNALGILVFAIFFGVTISSLKKEAQVIADFMESINKIFMRMILFVLWFSPIGIGSLIAGNLLRMQSIVDVVNLLGLYMATVIAGLVIHSIITLPVIYFIVTRKNPFKLYIGVLQALFTALGTSSSVGTLPLTMKCLENNIGVDKRVSRFVLPLGATMNMDGTALMEGVAAIAIAQMYEMNLTASQIVTISVTATLTSIGAAAIPSSGLVMLLIVLNTIGVPADIVGLLWSIDWFLDRIRTVVNVMGDSIGTGIVNHLNKDLLMQQDTEHRVKVIHENAAKELYQLCDSGVSVVTTTHQEKML